MKTFDVSNSIPVLIFLSFIFLAGSCKKDDDGNTTAAYRVIESRNYEDGELILISKLEYQDEKLSMINMYGQSSTGDSSKSVYTYQGQTVVVNGYSYYDGHWYEDSKEEMLFSNDLIEERIYYEYSGSSQEPYSKDTYQYDNGKLTEEISYYYSNGSWEPDYKIAYEYAGEKVALAMEYLYSSGWEIEGKSTYSYNGDNLSNIEVYYYEDGSYFQFFKYEYFYSGDKMTSMEIYLYVGGLWESLAEELFAYDSKGNVASWAMTTDESSAKMEFDYEEGKGNVGKVLYGLTGPWSYIPLPTEKSFLDLRLSDFKQKNVND